MCDKEFFQRTSPKPASFLLICEIAQLKENRPRFLRISVNPAVERLPMFVFLVSDVSHLLKVVPRKHVNVRCIAWHSYSGSGKRVRRYSTATAAR